MAEHEFLKVIAQVSMPGETCLFDINSNCSYECKIPTSSMSPLRDKNDKPTVPKNLEEITVSGRSYFILPGALLWEVNEKYNRILLYYGEKVIGGEEIRRLSYNPLQVFMKAPNSKTTYFHPTRLKTESIRIKR